VYLFGFYAILAAVWRMSLGIRMRGLGQPLLPRTQTAASTSR
jgi:hypothetical protein